jgi:hypothetical protein
MLSFDPCHERWEVCVGGSCSCKKSEINRNTTCHSLHGKWQCLPDCSSMHREFDTMHIVEYYTAQVTPRITAKAEPERKCIKHGWAYLWHGINPWYLTSTKRCCFSIVMWQYIEIWIICSICQYLQDAFIASGNRSLYSFWQPKPFKLPIYGPLKHGDKVNSKLIKKALNDPGGMYVCFWNGLLLSSSPFWCIPWLHAGFFENPARTWAFLRPYLESTSRWSLSFTRWMDLLEHMSELNTR